MLPLPAFLAGEVAVVFLAVGINCSSITQERVDLAIIGQVIEKSVDGSNADLRLLLGNFVI